MPTLPLRLLALLVVGAVPGSATHAFSAVATAADGPPDHLVISEVVTGGATASDEFIEIYNPTAEPLPIEGIELVYASASGLTVTGRAAWEAGAAEVPPGGHLLIANESGAYAAIADATYATGMAATGGSMALRIIGASSAIDAVGWGTAASTWLEGAVAPAPPAGSSIERLPGDALGSTQDTDDNAADFAVRAVPGPENSTSPPVPDPGSGSPSPSASASPSSAPTPAPEPTATVDPVPTPTVLPSATAVPSAVPTVSPTASPVDPPVAIAIARSLPDGTRVTIEGVALTGSSFTDGGGYVADASGGIAVLLTDAAFDRGELLRIAGEVDDRYAQRTLRATASDVTRLGEATEPGATEIATGSVGEAVEGGLVRMSGVIVGAPVALSSGVAFDVDDGSGPVRLLIGSSTGIGTDGWQAGMTVSAAGVVGQRDSTGSGAAGYRVQPRDDADILAVVAAPTPSPTATPTPAPSTGPSATPTPSPSAGAEVIDIVAARQLPKGSAVRVRGIVTLAPGVVDPVSAVIQDDSGGIILRVADETGPMARGTLVEIDGTRSTLAGLETVRVAGAARVIGTSAEPAARALRTGDAGEALEATLVTVRGGVVGAPRRSSAGTISFELDDGSGPLRVSIAAATGIRATQLTAGAWIEVRGVLGQETTGSLPLRGYRVWPRDASDVRTLAAPAPGADPAPGTTGTAGGVASDAGSPVAAGLESVGGPGPAGLAIGATLVIGPWEELGIGGLLWDGRHLVALNEASGRFVLDAMGDGRPPMALALTGLRAVGMHAELGIGLVELDDEPGAVVRAPGPPAPPRSLGEGTGAGATWSSVVGRFDGEATLATDVAAIAIDLRCDGERPPKRGDVAMTGILVGDPARLVVPCGGIVPAPALARRTVEWPAATEPPQRAATVMPAEGRENQRGGLPAALLLAAAVVLAGGAIGTRLAARNEPPTVSDAGQQPPGQQEPLDPPVLTLVPVPRERAP